MTPQEWLEREATRAENYFNEALAAEAKLESEFWRGYKNATINAIAAVFGPTDLDEEN